MNQPPGNGGPPNGPYPGYPQQGYPQQAQQGYPQPPQQQAYPQQAYPQPPQQPGYPPQQPGYPPQQQPLPNKTALMQQSPAANWGAQPPQGAPPPQQAYGAPPPAYGQPPAPGYGPPPPQPGMPMAPPGMQPPMGQPGMPPPGMPPQQQAQQGGMMPNFGVGMSPGGRVRVNMGGGQLHPMALYNAVVSGRGFEKPRLMGLGFVGLSTVFFVVNLILMFAVQIYFPYFWALVPLFGLAGWWMIITGQPKMSADGSPCPMWGRIGLAVCLVLGLLGGIGAIFAV